MEHGFHLEVHLRSHGLSTAGRDPRNESGRFNGVRAGIKKEIAMLEILWSVDMVQTAAYAIET